MKSLTQPIISHLWFDKEAIEAAEFYTSVFPNSRITNKVTIKDTPSGDADQVMFNIWGQPFMAISAGPFFKINPSISFTVNFDPSRLEHPRELLDQVWDKLSDGGTELMPLGEYPFSKRFGWIMDRYGVSWQIMLTDPEGEPRPEIIPSLLFVGDNCGKAEEARDFYVSVFQQTKPGALIHYGPGQEPDKEGTVMFSDFMLENTWFTAMDSAHEHAFSFNEAVSFMVICDDQEQIDYYWEKLSSVPEAEQCGWLKDRYGISWQIAPAILDTFMHEGTAEQRARVTQAFLQMKKFDIAELERAYRDE